MRIIIPDDYQDAVRGLACFSKLAGHEVTIFNDTVKDVDGLATRLEPDAILVNTSRAELIAPGALAAALKAGRPGFAAVDVYEVEPVLGANHPLLALDNAICTPHLGYVERDSYEAYFGQAFDALIREG